jgi:hypothetical protein
VHESWKHGKMDVLVKCVSCPERSVYDGPHGLVGEPHPEKSNEGPTLLDEWFP